MYSENLIEKYAANTAAVPAAIVQNAINKGACLDDKENGRYKGGINVISISVATAASEQE